MSSTTPVTQRDIARACRVHPSTICLALNNSPSIPASTRRRIQTEARRLGYQPNAAARNLAFMRNERRPGSSLPMAWINQEPSRDFWRKEDGARIYHESARRRAAELGYHLEEFWVHEPGMTLGRLTQIIRARGIECVMFPIFRTLDSGLFQPAWSGFSCVAFNDLRAGDWLDVVCPDYYHNTTLALERLLARGLARIGLVITDAFDRATNGLVRSRYLRHRDEVSSPGCVPVCMLPAGAADDFDQFLAWHEEHVPDAVLCDDTVLGVQASALGLPVTIMPLRIDEGSNIAGVNEMGGDVAATAVSCLADKVRRFEKGIGGNTRQHLVKGLWHATHGLKGDRMVETLLAG